MKPFYDPENDHNPRDGASAGSAFGGHYVNYSERGFKHAQELLADRDAMLRHNIIFADDGIPFTTSESITIGATKIIAPKYDPGSLRQYLLGFAEGIRRSLMSESEGESSNDQAVVFNTTD